MKFFKKLQMASCSNTGSSNFDSKVVLITGAAGAIGSHLAINFAKQGASVCINYLHSEKKAISLLSEIKKFNSSALLLKGDISKRDEIERIIKIIIKKFHKIDILINNAGRVPEPNNWREISEIRWELTLSDNLKSNFECSRGVGKIMLKQKFGKIINISSVRSLLGSDDIIAYSAAKAGVDNLTKSFAKALAPYVNVNSIVLGQVSEGMGKIQDKNGKLKHIQKNLMGRLGTPEDVCQLVLFLASEKSNFITGQSISLDGGVSLIQ